MLKMDALISSFMAPSLVMRITLLIAFVCILAGTGLGQSDGEEPAAARHFQVPMAEILQQPLYLSTNGADELVVKYSGPGVDLANGDYLYEADGVRILNGGLSSFLGSGEKEVLVPVIDSDDSQHGGQRLLGFVMLQSVIPRKIKARRGELTYDLEEGGAAPNMQIGNLVISSKGAQLTDDKDYTPPPNGGGACLTSRDCFDHSGNCTAGKCLCDFVNTGMTGSLCQLYRPDRSNVGSMMKHKKLREAREVKESQTNENALDKSARRALLDQESNSDSRVLGQDSRPAHQRLHASTGKSVGFAFGAGPKGRPLPSPPPGAEDAPKVRNIMPAPRQAVPAPQQQQQPPSPVTNAKADVHANTATEDDDQGRKDSKPVKKKVLKMKTKAKPKPKPGPGGAEAAGEGGPNRLIIDDEKFDETDTRARFLRDKKKREVEAAELRGMEDEKLASEQKQQNLHRAKLDQERAAHQEELAAMSVTGRDKRAGGIPADSGVKAEQATVEDLYGQGKAYPEPYPAGKVPPGLIHKRQKARAEKVSFFYSVRYRSGPLGVTFDNHASNETRVERVGKSMQSEQSDVQAGDVVIAVDQYNVTTAPAKITQRIMASLSWPRIVVYEVRGIGNDLEEVAIREKKRYQTFNILYPPQLQQELKVKLADWAPMLDNPAYVRDHLGDIDSDSSGVPLMANGGRHDPNSCPLFLAISASDMFGCAAQENEFRLAPDVRTLLAIVGAGSSGNHSPVPPALEKKYPMLTLIAQEAVQRQVKFTLYSAALVKRGLCTFVEKANSFSKNGAKLGLIVNSEDSANDMPRGRDDISRVTVPAAIANFSTASLLQVHASEALGGGGVSINVKGNDAGKAGVVKKQMAEVLMIQSEGSAASVMCDRLQSVTEDVVDAWPHSVPHVPSEVVRSEMVSLSKDPHKPRGIADEGGRVAISGENGWAFFDFHLANFGPQTEDLPLGPHKLTMAMPPFGCDPNAYTTRITGAVVAILRGGGCSFGIKVINAQKLGAAAVMIVNTDDAKTMRLQALPDEEPQIEIPCFMVSRRVQFFMEAELKKYYTMGQHLISIQPTGVFGKYEEKNDVALPERID